MIQDTDLSIARLLDDVRVLLVAAWDRREVPTRLVLNERLYRFVMKDKWRETSTGRPVTLLGLDLESAPDVAVDQPLVR